MKRYGHFLGLLALMLCLTACAQTTETPTVIATAEPVASTSETVNDGVYQVTNAAEFIAAIGPDREIRLAPGFYDLSAEADNPTDSAYCAWNETYDGKELVIMGAENLTITGAGKDAVTISATPRYAQVLQFFECENLSLTGFTAGHTKEPGSCVGGVVKLNNCSDVSIRDVGLYGCGVVGVDAYSCEELSIANSDIYECSYNGIQIQNSEDVSVKNCRLYDLGYQEEWEADAVFSFDSSTDITIADCEIYDNRSQYLVRSSGVDDVTLKNNVFRNNMVLFPAFGTRGNFVTLDGNTFEDCRIVRWFEDGCSAMDPDGNPITEEVMNGTASAEAAEPGEMTSVTVTNVDEFLAAIAPNTEIVLDGELFDLSTAKDYGGGPKDYYRWVDIYDGPGLVITNVDNLTIRSKDGKTKNHTISALPRYADVLTFESCQGIVLSGFTAGHTEEPGVCAGGVLKFQYSSQISVDNCGLFGCGILGVQAESCTDITLRKNEIYECSYGGVQMTNVTGIVLEENTFRDLGGNNIMLYSCSDVIADGQPLNGRDYNGR